MENSTEQVVKWLRVLSGLAMASLANSAVSLLPFVPTVLTSWISRAIILGMVVCMFRLPPANERYKKAAVMRAVMLLCTIITAFVKGTAILTFAASILSILAVYQEYYGHSELIVEQDSQLSRKWHSLFTWSLLAGVLVGFGSTLTVVILSFMGMDAVRLTAIIVAFLGVPQMILDIVYIRYLKKMTKIFSADALLPEWAGK